MTSPPGNPFESTQPARQYFVGRSREIREMDEYLNNVKAGGATNIYIVGGGGEGKTSFLYKIKETAIEKGLIATIITVSDGMDPDQVIYQLIEGALEDVAKNHGRKEYYEEFQKGLSCAMFKIPGLRAIKERITPKDLERDLESLMQVVTGVGAVGVVLCLDEGQRLKHMNGGALFATVRAAIQALGGGFMIVLAALEDIIPQIAEGYTGIDRFFPNNLPLGPFENDNVAVAAIDKRLEGKPIRFPRFLSEAIVEIAERSPKDIIDICHDIYSEGITSHISEADMDMLRKVVYDRYSTTVSAVLKTLGGLRPSDMSTLRKLLQLGRSGRARDVAALYCRPADDDCLARIEPVVYQELRVLAERGLCLSDITANEEVFHVSSGVIGYILTAELNPQLNGVS
jgi:AAA ATPase domain